MIKQWWQTQTPEKQLAYRRNAIYGGLALVLLSLYYASGQNETVTPPEDTSRSLSLGNNLLEEDIRAKVNKDLAQQAEVTDEMQRRLEHYETLLANLQHAKTEAEKSPDDESMVLATEAQPAVNNQEPKHLQGVLPQGVTYPPPPPFTGGGMQDNQPTTAVEPRVIGGIGRASGAKTESASPKKKNTFYMAPGFMPAILLTGLNAITAEAGEANPEPVILRVQAPAVLPNNVKAALQGCFVVANATGNLAQERVNLRLVSLSCLSMDGQAVIDQEVQGFVADEDGKRGMTGIVVTKAGAHVARMVAAGIFGGIGDSIAASSTTTSVSPLGSTQVVESDKMLQNGLGQGIKSGASAVQQLFLDLAKQTAPVIEVGAAKKVTVVIQKGVELEIRERDNRS